VENIIRIGTSGSYYPEVSLYELINVSASYSESTFAKYAFGMQGECMLPSADLEKKINETAAQMGLTLRNSNVHCSDIFYRKDMNTPAIAVNNNCVSVEMESFALFANAKFLGKHAACLLTISDVIPTHEAISADDRERSLKPMIELALESTMNGE
jgi:purine-nucleoside phosphorylase